MNTNLLSPHATHAPRDAAPAPTEQFIGEVREEDGTGQSQCAMAETQGRTEQYVQKMVTAAAKRKRWLQQGSMSEVPAGA